MKVSVDSWYSSVNFFFNSEIFRVTSSQILAFEKLPETLSNLTNLNDLNKGFCYTTERSKKDFELKKVYY